METNLLKLIYLYIMILISGQSYYMDGQTMHKVYLEDTATNFPNPERGFDIEIDPPQPSKITWKFCGCDGYTWTAWTRPLDRDTLKVWRQHG